MKRTENLAWFKIRSNKKRKASDSQYNSGKNLFTVISCIKTLTPIIKATVTVISPRPTEISNLNNMLLLSWIYSERTFCAAHFKIF